MNKIQKNDRKLVLKRPHYAYVFHFSIASLFSFVFILIHYPVGAFKICLFKIATIDKLRNFFMQERHSFLYLPDLQLYLQWVVLYLILQLFSI